MYIEDHVGSPIPDFCIGVHPLVVKKLAHTAWVSSVGALCCAAIADNAMRMVGLVARAQ